MNYLNLGYIYHNDQWYDKQGVPVSAASAAISSSGSLFKPAVGDVLTMTPPAGRVGSAYSMQINKGAGLVALVTGQTYTLQTADLPTLGNTWYIVGYVTVPDLGQLVTQEFWLPNPAIRPDAPTIGVATAGASKVTASFTLPANNGGSPILNVDAFLLDLLGAPVAFVPNVSSPFTFDYANGVTNGTSYKVAFRVNTAVGSSLLSVASNVVKTDVISPLVPGTGSLPAAPTLGDISAGDGVVVVPFTLNSDNGSAITSVTGTFGGVTATAAPTDSVLRFTGVANNTVGLASITVINGKGPSPVAISDPIRPAAGLVTNELTRLVASYPQFSNANSVYEPLGSMNTNFPAAGGGGPGTCLLIAELQADASHVRLIVSNPPNNSQPRTIIGATCAVSPTLADKTMDAAFAASLDLSFAGNAGITIPAVVNGSGQTFANMSFSDWLPITTVARTDVPGAPPIVAFRECALYPDYNNGAYGVPYVTLNGAQWGTDRGAMFSKCRSGNTLKSAHGAAASVGSTCTILGFQYRLKNGNGICVAWFGSSITNSDLGGLAKRPFSYGSRAASLNSSSVMPIEYVNGGQTGQTQDKAALFAETFIPLLKPTHTVIEFCNVNNIPAQNAGAFATLRTANDRIIAVANAHNSRVNLYNSYPRNVSANPTDTSYYDAAGDMARLDFHAEYKALGYPLLDTNSYMTDGNLPSALPMVSKGAPGNFTAIGDGVHHHTYSDTNVLIPRATAFVGRLRDRYFGV